MNVTAESAENIKATVGATKLKLNMAHMVLELPDKIKEIEEQLKRREDKVAEFKSAQEGGTIG